RTDLGEQYTVRERARFGERGVIRAAGAGCALRLLAVERWPHRHLEPERAAESERAFCRQLTAMQLDELARERQPQTEAVGARGRLFVRRENAVDVFRGDADAGVCDGDAQAVVLERCGHRY